MSNNNVLDFVEGVQREKLVDSTVTRRPYDPEAPLPGDFGGRQRI
jgi:hypothetical protein